ncbi:hypothetical protein ACIQF6_26725 [Kitasatospora sp. NPDC092948]|uniref:hypothetical protein n=1 Tax=Kitasatospora sp. NPDC092948 TaxID=3364088 RepID=UPI0037F3E7FE
MGSVEQPRRVVRPGPAAEPGRTAARGPAADRRPQHHGVTGDRLRRRPAEFLSAMRRLDAGLSPTAGRDLAEWLKENYTDEFGDFPLGFLGTCYLGPPFVDHQLSLFHTIVTHFAPGDPMPSPFAAARMLVRTGAYAYVEVYDSGLVLPVLPDGTVVRP